MNENYWETLVKEQIKVHLETKGAKIYSGIATSCDEKGIYFTDKFGGKLFFSYEDIKFIEPFREKYQSQAKIKKGGVI